MPTYEYECTACGHAFERFQSIKAAPIKICPECGKRKVKRLIGLGAGLLFKGSGFYITDYRTDSYNKSAKADAPPSATTTDAKPSTDAAAPAAVKTDSKSEPKAHSTSSGQAESKSETKTETKTPTKSADKTRSKRK